MKKHYKIALKNEELAKALRERIEILNKIEEKIILINWLSGGMDKHVNCLLEQKDCQIRRIRIELDNLQALK